MNGPDLSGGRVLGIVYGHVADTMASVPAFRSLRHAFPSARLEALVVRASAPVLRDCPYIDEVITWDDFQLKGTRFARPEKAATIAMLGLRLRRRRYDAVLVFHRSFRIIRKIAALSGAPIRAGVSAGADGYTHWLSAPGQVHSSRDENRAVLAAVGVEEDGGPLEIWPSSTDEAAAGELVGPATGAPLIGLHPGSDWSCQQWLPERWAAVARGLRAQMDARLLITGSGPESGLAGEIASRSDGAAQSIAGRTSLRGLASVIRRLDLLITVNSAPAAIARAVDTPAVVLVGPEDPRLTGLVSGRRLGVVRSTSEAAPGSWCEFGRWGVLSGCDSPVCVGVGGLDRIEVGDVVKAANHMLRAATPRELEVAL